MCGDCTEDMSKRLQSKTHGVITSFKKSANENEEYTDEESLTEGGRACKTCQILKK